MFDNDIGIIIVIQILDTREGYLLKLSKLKLHNYRCFGEDEQIIKIDDITSFIGNNSSGKTAALLALNCLFSDNSADRVLKRSDFHLPKDTKPEEMDSQELYIEAVFVFDELENGEEEIGRAHV